MFTQTTCEATHSVTSSPALECGATPFGAQAGPTIDLFGPVPVLANLSARQAKELGLMTSGTFGQRSSISSKSVALQSSLESRLRARTQTLGSTLYRTTWKAWDTPSQRSRSRLVASALPTSGSARIGALPTPTARDWRGSMGMENLNRRRAHRRGVNLQEFMQRELGRPGYLNPELPRLLMGLPEEWDELAPTETPSSRRKRKSLSDQ